MKHPGKDFYETWASRELNNPRRNAVLKWKAVNMANLILRTLGDTPVRNVCEIGGAEGIVLNTIGHSIGTDDLVNYELSSVFCEAGKLKYPDIRFVNAEFGPDGVPYDLVVLSDIIEHVENDDTFLEMVSKRCRFAILKIPIEKCVTEADLFYKLRGRSKPKQFHYGPVHINGHLRGYTLKQAQSVIAKHFEIVDSQESDVLYFYGTSKRFWIRRWLGVKSTIWLFGGALFVLGQSRQL